MSLSLPRYVSLNLTVEACDLLYAKLATIVPPSLYTRRVLPAHVTVCHHTDLNEREYRLVLAKYRSLCQKKIRVQVTGIAADRHCVALLVTVPRRIPVYPPHKNTHITMLLHNVRPAYANVMIARALAHKNKETIYKLFRKPFFITTTLSC